MTRSFAAQICVPLVLLAATAAAQAPPDTPVPVSARWDVSLELPMWPSLQDLQPAAGGAFDPVGAGIGAALLHELQARFIAAGCDVIETNSFGAFPVVLDEFGRGAEARRHRVCLGAGPFRAPSRLAGHGFGTGRRRAGIPAIR